MHEDQLIARARDFPRFHPQFSRLGIGDDGAILQANPDQQWVWAVDTLAENTHFRRSWPASAVGWKSVAVNMSDLAAMHAQPRAALLSLALPTNLDSQWIRDFWSGLESACQHYQVDLLGGDTLSAQHIQISLSVLGESARPIQRKGAQAGDLLAVTGCFGGAAAALAQLEAGIAHERIPVLWKERLWRPQARLKEAFELVAAMPRLSMLDTSDGLARSLQLLCEANNLGCEVNAATVPAEEGLSCSDSSSRQWILSGGEDFELLAAVPPHMKTWFDSHSHWTIIGTLTAASPQLIHLPDQCWELNTEQLGFQHF